MIDDDHRKANEIHEHAEVVDSCMRASRLIAESDDELSFSHQNLKNESQSTALKLMNDDFHAADSLKDQLFQTDSQKDLSADNSAESNTDAE